MYLKLAIQDVLDSIHGLQHALVLKADDNIDVIMPGYTHVQRAQPILFAHHMLAYYQMLKLVGLRFHFQYTPLTADKVVMTNRFIEEAWNKGDLSVLDELCDPNIITEQKQGVTSWRAAFPDLQMTVDEISAGNNKVTVEWTITGTHQGKFMGVAATGKKVKYSGIGVATFAGGKLSKTSVAFDSLNLWRQLGVDPPQPPAAESSEAE